MANIVLKTQTRNDFGKKNKELRKQGLIPGIVYGRKTASLALKIDAKEFLNVYRQAGDTGLIDLIIEENGQETIKKVLVQDVSRNYVTGHPLHIDFYEVEMDKPVTTHVPLVFIGESPAVKDGGVLVKSMDEIEIEALPKDLPHQIEVDISSLDALDKSLYVKDIRFPAGVKNLINAETPIITVSAPITEEKLEAELGKAKTIQEVEVEGEKREEAEEAATKEERGIVDEGKKSG